MIVQLEESDKCPYCDEGILDHVSINCSCHISPPCDSCLEGNLKCNECGEFFKHGTYESGEY